MAGNPNYDEQYAFAIAREISKKWSPIAFKSWPWLTYIQHNSVNFNSPEARNQGTKFLIPIMYSDVVTTARNETSTNYATPITPQATQGFTQAEFFYGVLGNALTLDLMSQDQLQGPEVMMPVLPGKVQQLFKSFLTTFNTQLVGSQNCDGFTGAGEILGEQYPLSVSNSPGNLSQSTYAGWQAGVKAVGGSFSTKLIDDEIDRIQDLGRCNPDFLQMSYTTSNNVYGKLTSFIGSTQILVKEGSEAKYGFQTFMYRGLECFRDGRLGDSLSGSMVLGSSSSWWPLIPNKDPILARSGVMRLPGTPTMEYYYKYTAGMGISDPACNTLYTGIAA